MARLIAVGALALGVVLAFAGAAFVQRAEIRLGTLPARVQAQLAAHGQPFVPLVQVPPDLIEATVAVEDRTFWSNPGVSLEGIARAMLVDVASAGFVQGGSTITQELVRDELLSFRKTLQRKATEVAYALLLTRRYPKRTILALYLNEVNYGNGAFGVHAAATMYFGLPPADLDLAQCALLAGLPQNPTALNPLRHPQAARSRQATVLQAMVAAHYISATQAAAALATPLGLVS